jgi:hypothetical protein
VVRAVSLSNYSEISFSGSVSIATHLNKSFNVLAKYPSRSMAEHFLLAQVAWTVEFGFALKGKFVKTNRQWY